MKPPPELIRFLQPYDPAIQKLALQVRVLVIEEMAPCYENIYDAYSAVAVGYGSSDRLKDGVCHIAVYSKHINLGFNHGAALKDPRDILKGSGTSIRHLTIESAEDLAKPEVRSFLRQAQKLALDDARKLGEAIPTAKAGKKGKEVISVVKAIYPKKRRPS
ncbi:MAG: DUF1801 domain-containing protein [Acidobacteriota bacterium]